MDGFMSLLSILFIQTATQTHRYPPQLLLEDFRYQALWTQATSRRQTAVFCDEQRDSEKLDIALDASCLGEFRFPSLLAMLLLWYRGTNGLVCVELVRAALKTRMR
jgi:hypothetical protein